MGLKTTNYEVKSKGLTLPEAYALVKELRVNGAYADATFAIQTSRENALKREPLETKIVSFEVDRTQNLWAQAYEKATETIVHKSINPETNEEVGYPVKMPFAEWENDLINT